MLGWGKSGRWISVPSRNLGKEEKYELYVESEQTFNTFFVFLFALSANTSIDKVKFRHRNVFT